MAPNTEGCRGDRRLRRASRDALHKLELICVRRTSHLPARAALRGAPVWPASLAATIASTLVALSIAGCTPTNPAYRTQTVLRIGFPYRFASLSSLGNAGFPAAALNALVYSYLLRTAPDGRLEPDLATSVPTIANGGISADGRTITYHLRSTARWQDGERFTADDVVFTVGAILNPRNDVASRDPYAKLAGVVATNAATIVVHLRRRDAAMVGLFFTPDSNVAILPRHLLAGKPDLNDVAFNRSPIGTGPYRVVAWDRGSGLRLAANSQYFAGAPGISALELRFMPDANTMLIALRTGEIDAVLHGDEAQRAQYAKLPRHIVTNVPYVGVRVAIFNTARSPLSDRRIRLAIASAIDRRGIANDVYHDERAADEPQHAIFSYATDDRVPWPQLNTRRAGALLDAAGWKRSPDGIRRRQGNALVLQTIFENDDATSRVESVAIQHDLAQLGVELDLDAIAPTQFWLDAHDGGQTARGRFDIAIGTYSTNVDPDVSWLLACDQRAPIGFNEARYCNSNVDRDLRDASLARSTQERRRALQRVQSSAAHDVPFEPIVASREIDVIPTWLKGFRPNGTFPFASAWLWRSGQ